MTAALCNKKLVNIIIINSQQQNLPTSNDPKAEAF